MRVLAVFGAAQDKALQRRENSLRAHQRINMPSNIAIFLSQVKKQLQGLLKDNLFGIYVFGSLTYGSFRFTSSDIDCVIVTNEKLSSSELGLLKKWFNKIKNLPLAKRLEMSFAIKDNLFGGKSVKTPKIYKGKFSIKNDSEAVSVINWLNVKQRGITVFGPKPVSFVPNISRKRLVENLKREADYIIRHPEIFLKDDWSRVYVVVTFCRFYYNSETGRIKSKMSASKWCLSHVPKKYYSLISQAIRSFHQMGEWKNLTHPSHGINEGSRKKIIDFSKYVRKELNKY